MVIYIGITVILLLRVALVMLGIWKNRSDSYYPPRKSKIKSMFVLGSGGHTFEMLSLVKSLRGESYSPRIYVIADTDAISEEKMLSLELKKAPSNTDYIVEKIPRSREVSQSWRSTVVTTLRSILYTIPLVFKYKPDLLLVNGPGTCIPVCGAALFISILGVKKVTIVFVESFCRVESLSLTGKILYLFADHFLVQWPNLMKKYPKSKCFGVLV